ncbi:copper resistance-associated P-type ATPase [Aspergillus luchuensis]|uniref:Copper resistance-associated P-type ATPase n=1 Tax=Aspergillus kawachii TaxID=1069201 RepID=A0A146FJJ3_ASPKA|nr:copper resistance-associated P-type ATPase [Aspergillus luchuensis]
MNHEGIEVAESGDNERRGKGNSAEGGNVTWMEDGVGRPSQRNRGLRAAPQPGPAMPEDAFCCLTGNPDLPEQAGKRMSWEKLL